MLELTASFLYLEWLIVYESKFKWVRWTEVGLVVVLAGWMVRSYGQSRTFGGNPQHTSIYSTPAQPLNVARWVATNDFTVGDFSHYGAPLITASNTVLLPVTIAGGFQVTAFEGTTGRAKYTLTNDYILPSYHWEPVYQPVLAQPTSGARFYYAGAGGTVYYITNMDSDAPSTPVRQCFYTNLTAYASNSLAFNTTVFINTPITADANGVIYFGFRVEGGTAPAPLNTTNSGFARMDPSGNGIWVLARSAAGDGNIYRDSHNCAPALSADGATLYVPVKGPNANYAYLLGLDSATLATKYKVFLRDPRDGSPASVLDDSTASPMIGPDGDVYFGVLGGGTGSRGFLLHFSADLGTRKTPGGFGWDHTPAVVPTNMVPSYTGASPYLLFSKYNNYDIDDGDGVNKMAILDPGAAQVDPHPGAGGLVEMREVLVALGCTPDGETRSTNLPYTVREWCINTTAVNPPTCSVFAPSEDGSVYRWNLASNSLTQVFNLGMGMGMPYIPAVIGPDGTVYTIHDQKLFALGGYTNVTISVWSSQPDVRAGVAGQPVVFNAAVSNPTVSGPGPTGTVTFSDLTYFALTGVTNILASGVPLVNGTASITNSSLTVGGTFPSNCLGSHFITAIYSGDTNFAGASATCIQKVHLAASGTFLSSAPGASNSVSFSATINPCLTGIGTPGLVSFWDGAGFLAQAPVNSNGIASFTLPALQVGQHAIRAMYNSDTLFASSTGSVPALLPFVVALNLLTNRTAQLTFTNNSGVPFSVLGSTDPGLPLTNWTELGPASEVLPGQFQFNLSPTANGRQFFRARSP